MLDFSTIKDGVLFALAIYGAGLSTWNFANDARKNRRQIQVTAGTGIPTYGSRTGKALACITATNVGHRPVTVTQITFQLPNGNRLLRMAPSCGVPGIEDTPLPTDLMDGNAAKFYISYAEIGRALLEGGSQNKTKLYPVCDDSAGQSHFGEPWEVDPLKFVEM